MRAGGKHRELVQKVVDPGPVRPQGAVRARVGEVDVPGFDLGLDCSTLSAPRSSTDANCATMVRSTASRRKFLNPVEVLIAHTFPPHLDPTRSSREMAIAWAEEERKAIEAG